MKRAIIRVTLLLAVVAMTVFVVASCGRQGPSAPPDTTPPSVVATSPANYGQNVAPNASISVTFSEPVNVSSIIFTLTTGSVPVDCTLAYSGKTATFSHSVPLDYGATYTATIKAGLRDLAGNVMTIDAPWTFTVGANPDSTPPRVIDIQPASRKTGVSRNTAIVILFSEALDSATTSSATIKLIAVNGEIPIDVSYNGVLNAAVVIPSHTLALNTTYSVVATTGIKDLAGNAMTRAFVSSFSTGLATDTVPPSISGTIPSSGATGVSVNTPITATFNEPIDLSTLSFANVIVSDGTTTVAARMNYINTTMILTPAAPLAYDTQYSVIIGRGISDLAHNSMTADYAWTFRTEQQGPDVIPPTIVWIDPTDTNTDVPIYEQVTALFSETMLATSVTPTSFILVDPNGNAVSGQVTFSGSMATYLPAQPLNYFTTYTAIIDQSLTDMAGNPLATGKTWSFTTQPEAFYTILASAGAGGTITPPGATSINSNGSQQYTITPATGYLVADVQVDGSSVGAVSNYAFTGVTSDHTISATFALNTFTITATVVGNGSISPSGSVPVNYGANQTFTIIPATGYYIADVQVDGSSVVPVPQSYTFTNVIANGHTINATFAINTYTITPQVVGGNGSILPSSPQVLSYGTTTTFTLTPNPNYHAVVGGTCGGSLVGTTYTINPITADCSVQASFVIDTYLLAITKAGTGTGNVAVDTGAITWNGNNGTATYDYGTIVTLTPTPDVSSIFTGWSGGGCSGTGTCVVTMDTVQSVTANFAINTYTITVNADPNGTVKYNGTVINSGGTVTVNYGATPTFTFTPNSGYAFAALTVDGSNQGLINPYTFSPVMANHVLAVSFSNIYFTITPTSGSGGTIAPSVQQLIPYGGNSTFVITPNTGYYTQDVKVDLQSVGTPTSYTFNNVTSEHTINATFTINTYTVTGTFVGNGTITPPSQTVNYNGTAQLSVSPSPNNHIVSVTGCGSGSLVGNTYTTGAVTADCTVTATFAIDTFTVTGTFVGNGTITPPSQTVNYGSTAQLSISPSLNNHIVSVTGCGSGSLVGNTYTTGAVTADCTVTATFAIDTFTVTGTFVGNGTITPPSQTVNYNGTAQLSVSPSLNNHIVSVTGCGGSLVGNTYTTGAVTADCTVTATFAIDTYTVTGTTVGNGTITPPSQTVNYNGTAQLSVSPSPNNHIVSVTGCGSGSLVGNTYTTGAITADCTVTATFAIDTYTITATATGPGNINPSGSVIVNYGTNQLFTITPNSTSSIQDVLVDGSSVGQVPFYNFNSVSADHTIEAIFQ